MTHSRVDDEAERLMASIGAALGARTRDAFVSLLTTDAHWGGEHGGNECTTREQAGDHYATLLAAGVVLELAELERIDGAADDRRFVARIEVDAPDPGDFPPELRVRLTVRDGLIADIRELDPPAEIEILHIDECPHHEPLVAHLRDLLHERGISARVTVTRIDDEEAARDHRFLGSPSVRVNGVDVQPVAVDATGLDPASSSDPYGVQCRVYPGPDGPVGSPRDDWIIDALIENPVHAKAVAAVREGDLPTLQRILAGHPDLARTRLPRHGGRTLLHVATDWPGHFPNVAATIATIVAAGGDPNSPSLGAHGETPLHWAASSDDLAAIDALLDHGADINARGAVIAGGTPMADATAFGQWQAARRLLERGADTNLFEAATLGLVAEVERHLEHNGPSADVITSSFWGACHGGRQDTAAVLLERGADINWVGYDQLTPLDAAMRCGAADLVTWLRSRGATSAEQESQR